MCLGRYFGLELFIVSQQGSQWLYRTLDLPFAFQSCYFHARELKYLSYTPPHNQRNHHQAQSSAPTTTLRTVFCHRKGAHPCPQTRQQALPRHVLAGVIQRRIIRVCSLGIGRPYCCCGGRWVLSLAWVGGPGIDQMRELGLCGVLVVALTAGIQAVAWSLFLLTSSPGRHYLVGLEAEGIRF
jgi:hypothetical protein